MSGQTDRQTNRQKIVDRQTEDLDLAMPSLQSCTEGIKGQLRNLCMQVLGSLIVEFPTH